MSLDPSEFEQLRQALRETRTEQADPRVVHGSASSKQLIVQRRAARKKLRQPRVLDHLEQLAQDEQRRQDIHQANSQAFEDGLF